MEEQRAFFKFHEPEADPVGTTLTPDPSPRDTTHLGTGTVASGVMGGALGDGIAGGGGTNISSGVGVGVIGGGGVSTGLTNGMGLGLINPNTLVGSTPRTHTPLPSTPIIQIPPTTITTTAATVTTPTTTTNVHAVLNDDEAEQLLLYGELSVVWRDLESGRVIITSDVATVVLLRYSNKGKEQRQGKTSQDKTRPSFLYRNRNLYAPYLAVTSPSSS